MRSGARLFLLALSCFLLSAASPDTEQPLNGYSAASSRTQRDWEEKFRAIPEPQNQRDYMQRLAARPHHVGSPYDKDNAEWMLAKFKEWGLDARSKASTFSSPLRRSACRVGRADRFTAKLAGTRRRRRSDLRPESRATAHLQRLLGRRRRYRAAGLRQLRHSG